MFLLVGKQSLFIAGVYRQYRLPLSLSVFAITAPNPDYALRDLKNTCHIHASSEVKLWLRLRSVGTMDKPNVPRALSRISLIMCSDHGTS